MVAQRISNQHPSNSASLSILLPCISGEQKLFFPESLVASLPSQSFRSLYELESTNEKNTPSSCCLLLRGTVLETLGFPQKCSSLYLKLCGSLKVGVVGIVLSPRPLNVKLWHCVLEHNRSAVDSSFHFVTSREATAFLAGQLALLFWNFF